MHGTETFIAMEYNGIAPFIAIRSKHKILTTTPRVMGWSYSRKTWSGFRIFFSGYVSQCTWMVSGTRSFDELAEATLDTFYVLRPAGWRWQHDCATTREESPSRKGAMMPLPRNTNHCLISTLGYRYYRIWELCYWIFLGKWPLGCFHPMDYKDFALQL